MPSFWHYFLLPSMWQGLFTGLKIAAVAFAAGLVLGLALAVARDAALGVVRLMSAGYVWLFRGTPILLQLVFLFNFLPAVGIGLPPLQTAMLGFALNEAGYCTEIFRGSLRSVSRTQTTAAASLGMGRWLTLSRIVLPQALKAAIPALGNEAISLVKLTSIASAISVTELTFRSQQIVATNFEVVPVYGVAAVMYLLVITAMTAAQSALERRFGAPADRPSARARLFAFRSRTRLPRAGRSAVPVAGVDRSGRDNAFLSIRNVSKRFGDREVLRDVSLDARRGEVLVLTGRSGSGKSTLLHLVNHLQAVDGGEILVDGRHVGYVERGGQLVEVADLARARAEARIGMVFQHFDLFENLSVLDNVAFAPHHVHGLSEEAARERARQLLVRVGLGEHLGSFPATLSGGQRQRVAIARALAVDPVVMLFDEPTSALDPELVDEVLDTVRGLAASGMTMLVVTHHVEFAREIADRVVVLADGRIVAQGRPDEVLGGPAGARG